MAEQNPPAEALAQAFHEAYERLAPNFGYRTREASAKPWAEVPDANRALMTAVCAEMLGHPVVLAAGRTAAAEDIRTEFERIPFVEDTELNQGSATALVEYCAQLAEGVREPVDPNHPRAARVAESGGVDDA